MINVLGNTIITDCGLIYFDVLTEEMLLTSRSTMLSSMFRASMRGPISSHSEDKTTTGFTFPHGR